ncbi:hypothetical protein GJ744_000349 [Endocarpon pusillum]|uniref:Uncharacterized protein n=1 Tax=Endocarpon pusillum TaxID=364733 RepID=A0A8H7ATQ0_9EURO|nr:hypothetical protein GJ744_000349 [Endocarpon pusillum]
MSRTHPTVLRSSTTTKERSRRSHASNHKKATSRKSASRSPEPIHRIKPQNLPTKASSGHSALAAPGKKAKLYIVQYYDPASYKKRMSRIRSNPDTEAMLDMPDPGSYAVFIEHSLAQTFLYIPEVNTSASSSSSQASESIPCYINTRPERKGHLIEGFVGDRDVNAGDVDAVRKVIGQVKMERGMETFDWAYRVLTCCEEAGLLRGKVSFPS